MEVGRYTIATRVYLDGSQRAKLERLLRHQARDLDDLLSELLAAHLAAAPEPPASEAGDPQAALRDELRRRRGELRRLQPQLSDPHNPAPAWLTQLAAELSAEIARLEAAVTPG